MKNLKKLILLPTIFALTSAPVFAQDEDYIPAYTDGNEAGYMSAILPITALVIAGVIIATTDNHHHHHSGSGGSSSSSSSHSHCSSSHCH